MCLSDIIPTNLLKDALPLISMPILDQINMYIVMYHRLLR